MIGSQSNRRVDWLRQPYHIVSGLSIPRHSQIRVFLISLCIPAFVLYSETVLALLVLLIIKATGSWCMEERFMSPSSWFF